MIQQQEIREYQRFLRQLYPLDLAYLAYLREKGRRRAQWMQKLFH